MADASAPATAKARFVRVTPMKARRVVDLIRGQQADEALAVLRFAPQAASEPVYKVLASAVANAQLPRRAGEPSPRRRGPGRAAGLRGRGPDAEAVPPPGPGPRVPRAQALQPHHRRSWRRGPSWTSRRPRPPRGRPPRSRPAKKSPPRSRRPQKSTARSRRPPRARRTKPRHRRRRPPPRRRRRRRRRPRRRQQRRQQRRRLRPRAPRRRGGPASGPEGQPARVPARHHHRLQEPVVRRQDVQGLRQGRRGHPTHDEQGHGARRDLQGGDRAHP